MEPSIGFLKSIHLTYIVWLRKTMENCFYHAKTFDEIINAGYQCRFLWPFWNLSGYIVGHAEEALCPYLATAKRWQNCWLTISY